MTDLPYLDRIADWAVNATLEDIPDAVIERAKIHLIDGISVGLAAGKHEALTRTIAAFVENGPAGDCQLVDGSETNSVSEAALINGMAAHIYDFDDTSFLGIVHGTAVIWPAALAMCQKHERSGRDLLLAFIVGSEALYTIGAAITNSHYQNGWWASASLGIFGATIAAGKAAGLSRDQMRQAIRLAATHAFGVKAVFGGNSKPFLLGRVAQSAVDCVKFGAASLTAPKDTFEGKSGFLHCFNDGVINEKEIDEIGKTFRLVDPGVAIKLFPTCSATQAGAEAVGKLSESYEFALADIEKVEVRVTSVVFAQLRYNNPSSVEEAQFSMPFAVASILLRNQITIEELSLDYIQSNALQTLMHKVQMIEDDSILNWVTDPSTAPEAAHAFIHLKSDEVIDKFNPMATGMPGRPIPSNILSDKFSRCTTDMLGVDKSSKLFDSLICLEQQTNQVKIL